MSPAAKRVIEQSEIMPHKNAPRGHRDESSKRTGSRPGGNLTGMAQLKAENEALRNEVMNLQVQWDILKTTLGVLSTTVGPHEPV
jgi:hypothetical protein